MRRQFTVTVPASELDAKVTKRLEEMKPRVNLKGFRPGKAPVSFLKKQFGKSVMGEVVEQAVNEGSQKAISDNQLKPALQPRRSSRSAMSSRWSTARPTCNSPSRSI